mmetsp:Transcript_15233/g.36554  ORF Transcript_15233/g.36554 Transcript_15233/m.36554 type:complete len:235 (-) Transcript_15233:166-870(-)
MAIRMAVSGHSQRVVTWLLRVPSVRSLLVHLCPNCGVGAGSERRRGFAVGRSELEPRDETAQLLLVDQVECSPAGPASLVAGSLVCDFALALNEHSRDIPIQCAPRLQHGLIVRQQILDRSQKMRTDYTVRFLGDAQGAMLLAYALDGFTGQFAGIDRHLRRDGDGLEELLGLPAQSLIGLIEDVLQIRVGSKHACVEVLGEGGACLAHQWKCRLDGVDMLGRHVKFVYSIGRK